MILQLCLMGISRPKQRTLHVFLTYQLSARVAAHSFAEIATRDLQPDRLQSASDHSRSIIFTNEASDIAQRIVHCQPEQPVSSLRLAAKESSCPTPVQEVRSSAVVPRSSATVRGPWTSMDHETGARNYSAE